MGKLYKIFTFVVLVILFLIFSEILLAFSIAIEPARIEIESVPSGKVEGFLKVMNNSLVNDQGFKIYVEDFDFNKDGGKDVKPAGSTPRSCANWIKLEPTEVTVKPGSFAKIKYKINVPTQVEGGYYALIFCETASPKSQIGVSGAALVGRLGATLLLNIKGTVKQAGKIINLKISRPDEDKPLKINFMFRNDGNVAVFGKGTLQITDDAGNSYWKTDFDNLNTMPEGEIEKSLEWAGKLDIGKYHATVMVDIGANQPVMEEVTFEVVKKAEIEKMTVVSAIKKPLKVYLKFANTGNLIVSAKGEIKIFNQKGEVVEKFKIGEEQILPDSAKVFTALFKKILPKGEYKALAEIIYDDEVLTKEQTIVVK